MHVERCDIENLSYNKLCSERDRLLLVVVTIEDYYYYLFMIIIVVKLTSLTQAKIVLFATF